MKRLLICLTLLGLLAGCGTTPVPEESQVPETVSPVYTDWSKLTPYSAEAAEAQYTCFEPYSGSGPLQPRDDYGPLLAYVGADVRVSNYIVDRLPLYGLVTADGQLVTAPIYAGISFLGEFLILSRGTDALYADLENAVNERGDFDTTIAASDGSWVREADASYSMFALDSSHLVFEMEDGSALVLDSRNTITAQFPRSAFEPYLGADFRWNWEGGPTLNGDNGVLTVWQYRDEVTDGNYNLCYLDLAASTVSPDPPEGWISFNDPDYVPEEEDPLSLPEYGYLEKIIDGVTGRTYYYGSRWEGETIHYDLLNGDGTLAFADLDASNGLLWQPLVRAGLVSTFEDGCFCYYSLEDGSLVFRYPLRTNSD